MDKLSRYMRTKLFLKLPPISIKRLELLKLTEKICDEHFWRKYCIMRQITTGIWDTSQNIPWETRARMWINRIPIWTLLEETPWNPDGQNVKYFWGSDMQCVIDYEQSPIASSIVTAHTAQVLTDSFANATGGLFTTNIGWYQIFLEDNIAYYVKYSPFDQLIVGFGICKDGTLGEICMDYSDKYIGETKNGLRQGDGVLKFTNGFIISTEYFDNDSVLWNDHNIVSQNTGTNSTLPGTTISLMNTIESILELYMHWCKSTDYINVILKKNVKVTM